MVPMDTILAAIAHNPGTSKEALCSRFDLTRYRLHRALRHVARDLRGQILVHDDENGVWIIDIDPRRCTGTDWMGADAGGYSQCASEPQFADGCCYVHSRCENPETVAFNRRLSYLCGPAEPSAAGLSELSVPVLEELMAELMLISPLTLHDHKATRHMLRLLTFALARRRYKDELRRGRSEPQIPREFAARHSASSINPFEFMLKKHFACLDLPCTATKEEVLKAWRLLAKKHHPDAAGGDEEEMKKINLAKEKIFKIRCWVPSHRTKSRE